MQLIGCMRIRTLIASLALALVGVSAPKLHAVIIDSSIPIPESVVLVNFAGSGLDWVYAGPLATNGWGVGEIYEPGYRSAEGWRYATEAEWAARPDWSDFIIPGHDELGDLGIYNHTNYLFASAYWGPYDWVDVGDARYGFLTNGNGLGDGSATADTWYVRDSQHASVPESTATIGLLLGAMVGLACFRRRR